MKYKVIFDTNSIFNRESNEDKASKNFLGYRKELSNFSKYCDLIIPDMAIEEIKAQKHRHFVSSRNRLKENSFYKNFVSNASINLDAIDIEREILKIEGEETLSYEVISLINPDGILEKMKELALQNSPPFDAGTDKGFKDAYIYFTILGYVESQDDAEFFVVTKDERLKQALKRHPHIITVGSYDEFKELKIGKYEDDEYLIKGIRYYLGDENITEENLIATWENTDGNDALLFQSKEQKYVLLISAREIYDHALFSEVQEAKNALINSGSFERTHDAIAQLKDYVKYLSDDDIKEILDACLYENEQISSIATDPDVKQFILDLSANKQHLLDDWTKSFIEGL